MPLTPFHLGPGIAVRAVMGPCFSLIVFGFAQVAIDVEPVVRIIRGDGVLHGFMHTYLGATLIALISVLVGRPVCQRLLDFLPPDPRSPFLNWLCGSSAISWPAAISGAAVGAYSHVFLDSIMHSDIAPFAPFSQSHAMLHAMPAEGLHLLCVLSGPLGALFLLIRFRLRQRSP